MHFLTRFPSFHSAVHLQLSAASDFHQKTNDRKYDYLKMALLSLLAGIALTALGGFVLLAAI
jgi:hypothetical protein